MNRIIERKKDVKQIAELIGTFPVTAVLGPRQSGKTFLASHIPHKHYYDLENPRDLSKLENPQLALESLEGLIVIDEIQRKPELFPLLRYISDTNQKQKYLILGSASPELIKQSSESLAGRIGYYRLGGFGIDDITLDNLNRMWSRREYPRGAPRRDTFQNRIKMLWLRGGLPKAFLANSEKESFLWLGEYINTLLERDLPQLGITIPAVTLRRFWMMLSHYHGQILNYSELGRSFGISDVTIKKYVDILEGTFMVRTLQPWFANLGKRLVKRPKIYIRDTGIFHSLISVHTLDQLQGHPKLGASWEGFAMDNFLRIIGKRDNEVFFWSTHSGAELDLFWQDKGKNWGAEFKYGDAPKMTKSMQSAIHDLKLSHLWVIYPGKDRYVLDNKITVVPLETIRGVWKYS